MSKDLFCMIWLCCLILTSPLAHGKHGHFNSLLVREFKIHHVIQKLVCSACKLHRFSSEVILRSVLQFVSECSPFQTENAEEYTAVTNPIWVWVFTADSPKMNSKGSCDVLNNKEETEVFQFKMTVVYVYRIVIFTRKIIIPLKKSLPKTAMLPDSDKDSRAWALERRLP